MPQEIRSTDAFRAASFVWADLTGATFRECDLTGVRIRGSVVADLRISGFGGESGRVVVDDVDVTAFVQEELDRRHPERLQLRAVRTADDMRAMWDTLERLWAETVDRAGRLPEAARHERVDGEWSVAETLRHLIFGVDVWVGRMVLGEDPPSTRSACRPPTTPTTACRSWASTSTHSHRSTRWWRCTPSAGSPHDQLT